MTVSFLRWRVSKPVQGVCQSKNRESGKGYFGIMIEIEDEGIGIVIEVKYAENESFDAQCAEALAQINDTDYVAELRRDDMQTILKSATFLFLKEQKSNKNIF